MQYAYPLLAIFIWAGNTVVNKLAVGSIFPAEIGFYRWLFAALLFTPFMLKPVVAHWPQIRPNLGKIFILGVLGTVTLLPCVIRMMDNLITKTWARSPCLACSAWRSTRAWRTTPRA